MPLILVAVIAFFVVAFLARRARPNRECRWRADASGNRGTLRKCNCAACGAEAFTSSTGVPKDCKSLHRPPSL
ncbi:MAG: hypothetical protein P8Q26_02935 [Ascidiaceihabitans sp.]|nr:hypothetical protein [Ascidiaceihabitans sp.]